MEYFAIKLFSCVFLKELLAHILLEWNRLFCLLHFFLAKVISKILSQVSHLTYTEYFFLISREFSGLMLFTLRKELEEIYWKPRRTNKPSKYCLLQCVVVVQSLSRVQLFATPWTATHQASLSLSPGFYSNSCPLSHYCNDTTTNMFIRYA